MADPVSRVSRVLMRGPLAPFAEEYRSELLGRGYTPLTAVNQLRQAARLSLWLDERGLGADGVSEERIGEFLGFQRAAGRHRAQWSRPGLLCLLDLLRRSGRAAAAQPPGPFSAQDMLLASFGVYLAAERGLAAGTIHGYLGHASRFLDGFAPPGGLAAVTAGDVTAAVLAEAGRVSVSAVQFFICGLRSFLRFCSAEGLAPADLSPAVLSMTGRRRAALPRGISQADAAALLDGCDRSTALGRRDYAIVITLLRLGLRAAEVAGLSLDDIDWRGGQLAVAGKGGRADRLPLPADAGEAIAAYLRDGRPASGCRAVFLTARAPFGPVMTRTVSSTVRRACRRAGIPEVGSHRLRHTAACEMVFAGVPLVQAAQVLRHRSLQTTALYARADAGRLRELALPWPGQEGAR
jgi:site-specific recombinase XerD